MKERAGIMKKILSLYHSGVGNTKLVSERITAFLRSKKIAIENYSVEHFDNEKIKNYEYLIIGFPTYYTKSSKVMSDYIDKLPRYEKPKYAFIYTTCGLFSGNALIDFSIKLKTKNIYVSHSVVYRCPATDFSLIMPSFEPTLTFENNMQTHIEHDLKRAFYGFKNHRINPPKFRLYSIFYTPFQSLKQKNTFQINYDLCTTCGKCVRNCPHNCFIKTESGIVFEIKNCENCYRCIHHCPVRALSLNGKTPKIVFDNAFYKANSIN
jgi:ferredoxin/flavodoxin